MTIPPPTSSGFTTGTRPPLYWAKYGPRGVSPLLVLHGGPGAHHDYLLPQMLELAREHELVFYDQRGGGRSKTDDRQPVTWRTHVQDLDSVIGEMSLGAPTIVGYSWGALLAMLFAIEAAAGRTEHRASRLVLIDPAPVSLSFRRAFESEFTRRQSSASVADLRARLAESGLREHDPEAFRQRSFELSVAGYFADPAAVRELTPFRVTGRVQQSVWDSLGDFDLLAPGQLDSVHLPAIVVYGRHDPIPLESAAGAARALGARLVQIDGSGHVPYVEQPDALFSAVRAFLGSPA
ncbi:MAG: alpha/beta fold hydrolase [Gemmatimonadaceae bacterium]